VLVAARFDQRVCRRVFASFLTCTPCFGETKCAWIQANMTYASPYSGAIATRAGLRRVPATSISRAMARELALCMQSWASGRSVKEGQGDSARSEARMRAAQTFRAQTAGHQ